MLIMSDPKHMHQPAVASVAQGRQCDPPPRLHLAVCARARRSDDGTAKLWDLRAARNCIVTFPHKYQVTSVCFSDQSDQVKPLPCPVG